MKINRLKSDLEDQSAHTHLSQSIKLPPVNFKKVITIELKEQKPANNQMAQLEREYQKQLAELQTQLKQERQQKDQARKQKDEIHKKFEDFKRKH